MVDASRCRPSCAAPIKHHIMHSTARRGGMVDGWEPSQGDVLGTLGPLTGTKKLVPYGVARWLAVGKARGVC